MEGLFLILAMLGFVFLFVGGANHNGVALLIGLVTMVCALLLRIYGEEGFSVRFFGVLLLPFILPALIYLLVKVVTFFAWRKASKGASDEGKPAPGAVTLVGMYRFFLGLVSGKS